MKFLTIPNFATITSYGQFEDLMSFEDEERFPLNFKLSLTEQQAKQHYICVREVFKHFPNQVQLNNWMDDFLSYYEGSGYFYFEEEDLCDEG